MYIQTNDELFVSTAEVHFEVSTKKTIEPQKE